jgi:hypothetical protein
MRVDNPSDVAQLINALTYTLRVFSYPLIDGGIADDVVGNHARKALLNLCEWVEVSYLVADPPKDDQNV